MTQRPRKRNKDAINLFAKNMRKIRQSKRLSMKQLGFLMNVEYVHVANLELGKRDPSLTMLMLVADSLNVTVAQLLEENSDHSSLEGERNILDT
jgi:transcriptional regulator with XRE-family HTH domain